MWRPWAPIETKWLRRLSAVLSPCKQNTFSNSLIGKLWKFEFSFQSSFCLKIINFVYYLKTIVILCFTWYVVYVCVCFGLCGYMCEAALWLNLSDNMFILNSKLCLAWMRWPIILQDYSDINLKAREEI